eukprot:TRINITY_DN3201_c0_g1_i5.p1 TRINITY_DN3201_c0_g1~~TRINITY_DN3201_c0_g1_i5.p1  ORF type:complete len:213 (-),score=15.62 TRINITY_DN3201_c0_g1_i5:206-844(-)
MCIRDRYQRRVHGDCKKAEIPSMRCPLHNSANLGSAYTDGHLGDLSQISFKLVPMKGKAHSRRNIFKSVLRHCHLYFEERKTDLTEILLKEGFSQECIDMAYTSIVTASENEIKKGTTKKAQRVISKMAESFSIYSFLLRDTLKSMLATWERKEYGKMYRKSLPLYKDFCVQYLMRVNHIINTEKEQRRSPFSQQLSLALMEGLRISIHHAQ